MTDYEVGFGKPPVGSRFKKGQSGNPKGRRRGVKTNAQVVENLLDQTITLMEQGVPVERTYRELRARKQLEKAIKTGCKHANAWLDQHDRSEVKEDQPIEFRLRMEE